ncbi:hypothetical protein [Pseudomonas sp. dw_358]|uniref:hypothetical protein n=1 Tax=Pseudomonas sp. dw_358 TaxID=2720083 RepID=UPI001BD539CE|nr:hypothetical protein [Pseudomonas sp. dw_358]
MNALARLQQRWDNLTPADTSPQDEAASEWLYNATEQLVVFGSDVVVQRRLRAVQSVTQGQFALAVDEHVNNQLAGCQVDSSALGSLIISVLYGNPDKIAAKTLLGSSDHPMGALGDIAERLLKPLVEDGLAADAEDAEL